jgi:hypothetical protein
MDLQISKRDSTRVCTTHNWTKYYYTLTHRAKYILNPNYIIAIEQDTYKLLAIGFIQYVKGATWLSPIVVVPRKNGKLKIYINFIKLNAATKKNPYPLPFTNEVLNTPTNMKHIPS